MDFGQRVPSSTPQLRLTPPSVLCSDRPSLFTYDTIFYHMFELSRSDTELNLQHMIFKCAFGGAFHKATNETLNETQYHTVIRTLAL